VLDLFPPGPRDPQGIHKAIWDEIIETTLLCRQVSRSHWCPTSPASFPSRSSNPQPSAPPCRKCRCS
jgi:hypothetical protein